MTGPGLPDGAVVLQARGSEALVLSRRAYRGREFLDLRRFWLPDGAEEWRPTRRGVTVPVDLVPDLAESLARLLGEELGGAA